MHKVQSTLVFHVHLCVCVKVDSLQEALCHRSFLVCDGHSKTIGQSMALSLNYTGDPHPLPSVKILYNSR